MASGKSTSLTLEVRPDPGLQELLRQEVLFKKPRRKGVGDAGKRGSEPPRDAWDCGSESSGAPGPGGCSCAFPDALTVPPVARGSGGSQPGVLPIKRVESVKGTWWCGGVAGGSMLWGLLGVFYRCPLATNSWSCHRLERGVNWGDRN